MRARLCHLMAIHVRDPLVQVPFWAVTLVHLGAQLGVAADAGWAAVVAPWSKTLLMPALALVLVAGLRGGGAPRWWPLAALALAFSWFGDLALISDDLFLVGVGLFGVAQVAYAFTFRAAGDPARTAGRRWQTLPYVGWWCGLFVFFLVTDGPGVFLVAVGLYGIALGSMAWLARRISTAVAVGAVLFVLSDSLIGLGGAGLRLPAHGFWVMLTYLVAQWLIVTGLVQSAVRSSSSATSAASTPSA